MAIRMRINKDRDAKCKVCGATRKNSLELFDIAFTDKNIITICDLCTGVLLNKTLKATCGVNGKIKSRADMAIIGNRFTNRLADACSKSATKQTARQSHED